MRRFLFYNSTLMFFITTNLLATLISTPATAAPKKKTLSTLEQSAPISTRAKAQSEINSIPKTQKQSSTDAQFNGILKLKDPRPQIITRDWTYFLGFKLQSLQPLGNINNSVIGSFDIGSNATAAHPSVELGFAKPLPNDKFFVNWGLVAQTGFSSEAVKLIFPSGYSAPQDTRLNTFSSSLGGRMEISLPEFSALYFNSSARIGRISYTQTSLNDLAQFSEAATYWSFGIGASYNLYDNWQLTADYANRKINEISELNIQANNAEVGLRMIW